MVEPRYIQRDPKTGEVVGHYSNPQPYATEAVDEDHPDILKWREKLDEEKAAARTRKKETNPVALLKRIEELEAKLAALVKNGEKE